MRNNIITTEIIIIVLLIIFIKLIPHVSLTSYKDSSDYFEHFVPDTSAKELPEDLTTDENEAQTLVAVSRPIGGYNAYENGTFVEPVEPVVIEPTPEPVVVPGEDPTVTDPNTTPEATPTPGTIVDDHGWSYVDPSTAYDTGLVARTNESIRIRTSPYTGGDSNVMDTLPEGYELIVTNRNVTSDDAGCQNWVEVFYCGEIGYVAEDFVYIY